MVRFQNCVFENLRFRCVFVRTEGQNVKERLRVQLRPVIKRNQKKYPWIWKFYSIQLQFSSITLITYAGFKLFVKRTNKKTISY